MDKSLHVLTIKVKPSLHHFKMCRREQSKVETEDGCSAQNDCGTKFGHIFWPLLNMPLRRIQLECRPFSKRSHKDTQAAIDVKVKWHICGFQYIGKRLHVQICH